MSNLDDLFAGDGKNDVPEGILIDLSISCPTCGNDPIEVYYNKEKKRVIMQCAEGEGNCHSSSIEMDLSFIYG